MFYGLSSEEVGVIDDWDELGYPAAPTRVFRTEHRNGDPLLRKQELFPCRYDTPAAFTAPVIQITDARQRFLDDRRRFG